MAPLAVWDSAVTDHVPDNHRGLPRFRAWIKKGLPSMGRWSRTVTSGGVICQEDGTTGLPAPRDHRVAW